MLAGWLTFVAGSPMALCLWIGNRLAAWTGLAMLWRNLKHSPGRFTRFLMWGAVINVVSILCVVGLARMLRVW